jgi:FkbM family methyltransferase
VKIYLGKFRYSLSQTLRPFQILVHPKHDPEVEVLPKFISQGDIALDLGAHYGQYTRVLSRLVGAQGRIFAFEPALRTFKGLKRSCKLLRLNNVTLVHSALSDESGKSTLHTPIKSNGSYGISLAHLGMDTKRSFIKELVSVTRLDEFIKTNQISSIAFIKCDVEGAELKVFQGGQKTLEQFRPKILCEVNRLHLARHQQSPEQLEEFFRKLGYRFFVWRNHMLKEMDTMKETQGTCNYFLIPGEFMKAH